MINMLYNVAHRHVCTSSVKPVGSIDIANLQQPLRYPGTPMTNPHGLSKDGDLLFIRWCRWLKGVGDAAKPTGKTVANHKKEWKPMM